MTDHDPIPTVHVTEPYDHECSLAAVPSIPASVLARELIAGELVRIVASGERPLDDADAILTALAHAGLYVAVAGDELP